MATADSASSTHTSDTGDSSTIDSFRTPLQSPLDTGNEADVTPRQSLDLEDEEAGARTRDEILGGEGLPPDTVPQTPSRKARKSTDGSSSSSSYSNFPSEDDTAALTTPRPPKKIESSLARPESESAPEVENAVAADKNESLREGPVETRAEGKVNQGPETPSQKDTSLAHEQEQEPEPQESKNSSPVAIELSRAEEATGVHRAAVVAAAIPTTSLAATTLPTATEAKAAEQKAQMREDEEDTAVRENHIGNPESRDPKAIAGSELSSHSPSNSHSFRDEKDCRGSPVPSSPSVASDVEKKALEAGDPSATVPAAATAATATMAPATTAAPKKMVRRHSKLIETGLGVGEKGFVIAGSDDRANSGSGEMGRESPLSGGDKIVLENVQEAAEQNEDQDDGVTYPGKFAMTTLTIGLFLATFVVALDNTIIATAIPRITTDFNSLGDVGWYGSSYLLTTTSLQPSFGKVYTYFDVKWTYLSALLVFEIGSIVCATAPNSVALIVGRAIAGIGASGLFSGGMTIIGYSVPLRKRAFYIAVLSSTFGIASVVGPLLGGVFTDSARLTWRFCFWINLPFGGLAILTTVIFFKSPERKHTELSLGQKIAKMDLIGAFFLICGIVCLLLALQWGGTFYPWRDSRVWGCLLGFGLLIAVFIGIQAHLGEEATIPPRLLNQRTVRAGCIFTSFLSMGLYTHIYYLPFYFQAIKGTSAEGSGIRTIPYLVSITLASIAVGASVTKFGWYAPFLWFGSAVFTVGCGMLYTLRVGSYAGEWIGYQILAGLGAGSSVQIPFIAVQVVLSAKDMPSGNALTIFFNSLGGALSISIAQNIFSNTLAQRLAGGAVPLDVLTAVISSGATNVRAVTPPQYLDVVLAGYNEAVTRAFILPIAVGGIAFLGALSIEWKSVKGKKLDLGGGAA